MDLSQTKRLKILSENEINSLYNRPVFSFEDQQEYFSLSESEKEFLDVLRSTKSKVYFILQLGYFKLSHQFFVFTLDDVEHDVQYIITYILKDKIYDLTSIDKNTRLKQQQIILNLFSYKYCDSNIRQKLEEKASKAVKISCKPIYIFREIINYLSSKRILIPSYSFLQKIIGNVITNEQERLTNILKNQLNADNINSLKVLLEDSSGLHEITKIKHEPKDFSLKEIKHEIERRDSILQLFRLANEVLPKLKISNESIKYYSSLVIYYSVFRLKRLNKWIVFIYLLCFIYNRYQKVNDNLINSFIYKVRQYSDTAKFSSKEKIYEYLIESNKDMKKAGEILNLLLDDKIDVNTPFKDIKSMVFEILGKEKLKKIATKIALNKDFDEANFEWEHIDTITQQFKIQLRPLLLKVEFASSVNNPLLEAINFIKQAIISNKPLSQYRYNSFPEKFIPKGTKKHIYKKKELLTDRYEFLVYKELRKSLESGDIYCHDSICYRSLEDDLIDDEKWKDKEKLILDNDLITLTKPIEKHLDELEKTLEKRIYEINQNINSGKNKHFEVKNRGKGNRWHLKYSSDSETAKYSFFNKLKPIDINDIIHFVNQKCNFAEAFEHILERYSKQKLDMNTLIACLVAWGTNMGLGRMGEISDIDYSTLSSISNNFIRLETLEEANNIICNAISKLLIFEHYNIDGLLHSSSDGQKKEVIISTINARHSSKYFGLSKGTVEYNLIINNVPVNAKIIGANEHESHFVYDILFNNNTDIKPEIHSTDTHGTNEVNFAILNFFGYQFAPRYKDIYDVVSKSLYGFKTPGSYDGIVKPVRKINKKLIINEWENIKRIVVSLALKTTTQSTIIGKLSSHRRKNKTKKALWEYDNIIKSIYLLNYIDSLKLRQNIQKALNRGESYHKLKKAISYANFGKLRYKTEYEQQIWSASSRLLANCIIYYNATILSKLLNNNRKDESILESLKKISPVSWQHINFFGHFEFNKNPESVNIDKIIENLEKYMIDIG